MAGKQQHQKVTWKLVCGAGSVKISVSDSTGLLNWAAENVSFMLRWIKIKLKKWPTFQHGKVVSISPLTPPEYSDGTSICNQRASMSIAISDQESFTNWVDWQRSKTQCIYHLIVIADLCFFLSRPGSQERLKGEENLKGRIDFTRLKFQITRAWVIL